MKRQFAIAPFLGVVTSVDSRAIGDNYAQDSLNVRIEDGSIKPRYGYRVLSSAPSGFQVGYGLDFLQGYNSSYAEVEEFLSFEQRSSVVKPYSVNPTTGVRTEITNGGTPLSLVNQNWKSWAWQDTSYILSNNGGSVYRHTIGDNSSFTPVAIPTAPSTRLSYTVSYGGTSTPYATQTFTGVNVSTHVTYTGRATSTGSSVDTNGNFIIGYNSTGGQSGSVDINFGTGTGSDKDWQYNDIFAMSVTSQRAVLDPASVKVTLYNSAGTALVPNTQTWVNTGSQGTNGILRFEYSDKVRASFGAIRRIKFEYTVSSSSGSVALNAITLAKPIIGGVWLKYPDERQHQNGISFTYSYYYSGAGFESGLCGSWLFIPNSVLQGVSPGQNLLGLGTHIELTATVSGDSNVDYIRFYAFNPLAQGTSGMQRLATQADSDLTFDHKLSWPEVLRLTEYQQGAYTLANVKAAVPFRGWMVWLYKGGRQNVRHSRIGEPEKQASDLDVVSDLNRGATFSLADNYADEPQVGHAAGEAIIIFGNQGVYAQIGDRPANMTPPKKLPGSVGIANDLASARWRDEAGNPAVAYLDRDGAAIWLVTVSQSFDGENGFRIAELTAGIRGKIREFLLDGQSGLSLTNFDTARLAVDEATDSLWLIMGARAMVLRRPSVVDGQRPFEFYVYNLGDSARFIPRLGFSTKRRAISLTSDGRIIEHDWDSSNRAWITGTNRDGGNAISSLYWRSKTFSGPNRRVFDVMVERDSYTDTPSVTVTSDRQTTTATYSSGKRFVRFHPLQMGYSHDFKVTITENSGAIRRLVVTEYIPMNSGLKR